MSASYNNGTVTFNGLTVAGPVGGDRIELAASFMFSARLLARAAQRGLFVGGSAAAAGAQAA